MMQTLEATLDERGHVHFVEPVKITGLRRVLVTLLDSPSEGGGPFSDESMASSVAPGNRAAMLAALDVNRLSPEVRMSADEIATQIEAERNDWG